MYIENLMSQNVNEVYELTDKRNRITVQVEIS